MTDLPPSLGKRRQMRHPLTGDLTGSVVSIRSGSQIPCVAVDVSIGGLCVILSLDLLPGTELLLKLPNAEARLDVIWCRKELSRKGYFCCGLMAPDPNVNLVQMFNFSGLMNDDNKAAAKR